MSATPVINNLQEGKSLVKLITGVHHNELDIRPTLPNCMKLHQRFVTLGIGWIPEYNLSTLKLDGQLHIIEVTSRFSNLSQFRSDLEALGFDVVSDLRFAAALRYRNMWKFTHIRAMKTERKPPEGIELRF